MDKTPTYQSPSLVVVGTLTELTRGSVAGNYLDHSYPTNTPKSQLTFSG
jgi:hypothetical protein